MATRNRSLINEVLWFIKMTLLKRMKYDFVRLIERVLVKVNNNPWYRLLTMSPIHMILWSAFFRAYFPKSVVFWNNRCDEIVGFVFPLCRKTFSIGVWLTSVWIMANAHSFCPWPNISEKIVRKVIHRWKKCCIATKWAQTMYSKVATIWYPLWPVPGSLANDNITQYIPYSREF